MGDGILRMALVGCGAHAQVHARAIAASARAELVACCDLDEARARIFAAEHRCAPHGELPRMLAAERIDAVVLCTWPNLHLEQIRRCLASGVKNVLCEKSLTVSAADALEILSLVRAHGALLVEGVMYRHHPAIRKVEELAFRSGMGPVDCVRAAFSNFEPAAHDDALRSPDWRYRPECGGGVTHDWLAYCVDASNHFAASRPRRVFASGNVNERYGVIDRLHGQIEYQNGVAGIVESSKHASFTQMLQVSCAGGMLRLPVAWGIFGDVAVEQLRRKPEWDYVVADSFPVAHADAFALQLEDFVSAASRRSAPLVPLEESVAAVITIDALARSLRERRVVEPDFSAID
jgi:xylose dehydrogenase (NAD/NADP)